MNLQDKTKCRNNMKVHLVSLGCVRNQIDSEVMLGALKLSGCIITPEPDEAETIVINTCSFIESAVNESIDTILELAKFKNKGLCKRIIVTGCLPERFREDILSSLPEVDVFLGTGAYDKILQAVLYDGGKQKYFLPSPFAAPLQTSKNPRVLSLDYLAYVRVSEGCSRHCSYCIIPKLRGKQKSRPPEDIISEVRLLVMSGVKEIILVAQDTTGYGSDLNPHIPFSILLENISSVLPDDVWIRILYGHPESIDESLLETVEAHKNICSYFDIPVQHVSSNILKKMGRGYSKEDLYRLFNSIRMAVPEAAIRTTLITGFPGETPRDFEELVEFVNEINFNSLGVFIYSDFKDLPSHKLSGHVPKEIAKNRSDIIMSRQREISREKNSNYIGKVLDVLVEGAHGDNIYTCRTSFQAPEVDGITYVNSGHLQTGSFARVKIDDALEYDLIGKADKSESEK